MSADEKSIKTTQHAKVFEVWSVSACTNIITLCMLGIFSRLSSADFFQN